MSKLPGNPAELIRVALSDLRKVEADPRYDVDMRWWHKAAVTEGGVCSVCPVGAVMAGTLGADPESDWEPWEFDDRKKLFALDYLILGWVSIGLNCLDAPRPAGLPSVTPITPYDEDLEQFHKDMSELADMIEAAGAK